MDNGNDERLAERISSVGLEDSSNSPENEFKNDSFSQVIEAINAAKTVITQQAEETSGLKAEIQRTTLELAKYKSDESLPKTSNLGDRSNTTTVSRLVHPHVNANGKEPTVSDRFESHSVGNISNGIVRGAIDGAGPSQFDFSPEISLSPMGMHLEREHATHASSSTHGSVAVADVNQTGNAWKQDLIQKVQENEQEILQLRKYLTKFSVKVSFVVMGFLKFSPIISEHNKK